MSDAREGVLPLCFTPAQRREFVHTLNELLDRLGLALFLPDSKDPVRLGLKPIEVADYSKWEFWRVRDTGEGFVFNFERGFKLWQSLENAAIFKEISR